MEAHFVRGFAFLLARCVCDGFFHAFKARSRFAFSRGIEEAFMNLTTKKIALTAVMSALAAALTLVSVPLPGGGYYNFGDVAIFSAAATLGPFLAALVGGLGGALGDLILGYTFYAPFTLLIKAVEALVAGALFALFKRAFVKESGRVKNFVFSFLSNLAGGLLMAAGYFVAEGLLLAEGGWQGGLVNLPWNVLQGAVSAVVAPVLLFVCRIEAVIHKTLASRKVADGEKDAESRDEPDKKDGDETGN